MAWQSLKTTLTNKPLVLAGPMLRKVTDSSVTVLLALKESAEVTLEIYASDVQVVPMLFSGQRKTVRIGRNLHVVAVTARRGRDSKPPLTPGTGYHYDLSFTPAEGKLDLPKAVRDSPNTTSARR